MSDIFITSIDIAEVRHIKDFSIPISETERKHLIITGRNGSGKTSVLEEIRNFLLVLEKFDEIEENPERKADRGFLFQNAVTGRGSSSLQAWKSGLFLKEQYFQFGNSLDHILLHVSPAWNKLWQSRSDGQFLFAYLPANHLGKFEQPKEIGLVEIPALPSLKADLGSMFWKYLVFLRAKQANAFEKQDFPAHQAIKDWFAKIEGNLASLLGVPDLRLEYEFDKLTFWIVEPGKEKYSLNELSDGFSAILRVVSEILMRMSKSGLEVFDMQGIVLIDEIESHLHIDLQKKILPFLTGLFPKIQFIVTTHSPFVLNSISNAVICDLEKEIVTEDLHGYSSEAIVESYFGSDKYSEKLKSEVAEYEALMSKEELTDKEADRLDDLAEQLATAPTFMAEELALKLSGIRLKYRKHLRH